MSIVEKCSALLMGMAAPAGAQEQTLSSEAVSGERKHASAPNVNESVSPSTGESEAAARHAATPSPLPPPFLEVSAVSFLFASAAEKILFTAQPHHLTCRSALGMSTVLLWWACM